MDYTYDPTSVSTYPGGNLEFPPWPSLAFFHYDKIYGFTACKATLDCYSLDETGQSWKSLNVQSPVNLDYVTLVEYKDVVWLTGGVSCMSDSTHWFLFYSLHENA